MPNHHASNPSASRSEREPLFPGRAVKTTRCPDCEIEDRLNTVGKRRFNSDYGTPLTMGCETCGGSGEVPRLRDEVGRLVDPMELSPKRPWWT